MFTPIVSMTWKLVRPLIFLCDSEFIHNLSTFLIRSFYQVFGRAILRIKVGGPITAPHPSTPIIGLAAGFDKNAEWLPTLPSFGFQFTEIGTVTPRPQSGNDKPRLFREVSNQTLFNRMGFNNLGATMIAERLRDVKPTLPQGFEVGVNIGKNKNTRNDDAALDYAAALSPFAELVDYAVINVSSPNTVGLRDLQTLESLFPIVQASQNVILSWKKSIPLYVKLAPEVSGESLSDLIQGLESKGIDGFILTNTLAGQYTHEGQALSGGWSGSCLTETSLERLKQARSMTKKTLISVGGIMSGAHAIERIQAGADRIQVYSGWIYGGPSFPWQLRSQLDNTLVSQSNR
ncbi:MAG: quinone-dependent dihydroorotate dehydrogenase [Xanthomonadaceae bacterium]|nr:quinone-dependent dihydroorotate dehydrogenase [Xanthomonadaceae bacterium]